MSDLDRLVAEVQRRKHYLGIVVYPPDDLLDGVVMTIEKGPDRNGTLYEIHKVEAASIEEGARRLLDLLE